MLDIRHIVKSYHKHLAVDDVSFVVKKGIIFGLLGPNGAGKSSLLRMITGITLPDSGQVLFNGKKFNLKQDMEKIGYMPEERGLYKKMKVHDQLLYLAQLKGLKKNEAEKEIHYWYEKLGLSTWRNKKVEDLSKGMSQKLQFVATVVHKPDLLILDEPFSGLDPVNTEIIKEEIFNLAQQGYTIIFSTHRMEQVEEICQEIVLMNKGQTILSGSVSNIRQQFKEGLFEVHFDHLIEHPDFDYISCEKNTFKVKLHSIEEKNGFLQQLLSKGYSISSFREILPTLNEIFIKSVNDSAIRIFE